jgi:SAM-dependent methyltransferase
VPFFEDYVVPMSQASLFESPSTRDASIDGMFRVVPRFPAFDEINNGDLFSLSLTNRTSDLTHGLHRFPAKYIPQIPAWAMEEFANHGSVVLDPFCGSGTTVIEALHRCRTSIGIDCDPLAVLIARAKTGNANSSRMSQLGEIVRKNWLKPATELRTPMPGLVNFTHWFSESSWGWLQSLMAIIKGLDCSEDERSFMLCVFSSIVRWVSNADDQTQKTYVSGTLKKSPPAVVPTFCKAFDRAVKRLLELELYRLAGAKASVKLGDAANIELPERSVDLIVTSPPYLDSVDYMYNFMLEYFWMGPFVGVDTREKFNQMRRRVIGAKNPLDKAPEMPPCLNDLVAEADIMPFRLPATRTYCHNMAKHFASAYRVLKPDARYALVIGNSQTKKGVLPIHDSLIRLAADAGFAFEKAFAYRIRRHYMKFPRKGRGGIILMDWVVILKRAKVGLSYADRLPLPDCRVRDDEVAH